MHVHCMCIGLYDRHLEVAEWVGRCTDAWQIEILPPCQIERDRPCISPHVIERDRGQISSLLGQLCCSLLAFLHPGGEAGV